MKVGDLVAFTYFDQKKLGWIIESRPMTLNYPSRINYVKCFDGRKYTLADGALEVVSEGG